MSGGGGPGAGDDKSSTNILWAIAGIFIVMLLIWHFFKDYLIQAFLFIKLVEIKIISIFTDNLELLGGQVSELTTDQLNWQRAEYISSSVGDKLAVPIAVFLGVVAIIIVTRNVGMRFTKKYDMTLLLKQEKNNWPQITPVEKLNLTEVDINTGPWAMSQTPIEFCKKYNIMDIELVPDPKSAWKREPAAKVTLKKEKAKRVLAWQLGPHWQDANQLPIHVKALFAVFAARMGRDQKGADALLAKISASASGEKLNFDGVDSLLKKHGFTKEVQKVVSHHAYVYTVMMSMIATARNDGVIPSSTFLWLKPIDRKLWYVLNCVGRQVAYAECAGVFAHWKTELEMGRALNSPFVDEAITAFETALTEIIYTPSDEEVQKLLEKQQG